MHLMDCPSQLTNIFGHPNVIPSLSHNLNLLIYLNLLYGPSGKLCSCLSDTRSMASDQCLNHWFRSLYPKPSTRPPPPPTHTHTHPKPAVLTTNCPKAMSFVLFVLCVALYLLITELFFSLALFVVLLLCLEDITKTRLFKYIENFTSKKPKIFRQTKTSNIFIFLLKHRL